ncbi:MAG: DUF169 domain-containing protein [Syntrophales bacterium]|nr:DUF169 domain-containing protein [Syntrophales bacterium]
MRSKLAVGLNLKYQPVAILWTDVKPEGAKEFRPGRWGCVMWMLSAAAKGTPAVFSRETYGCWGGGVGLGFGNQYLSFPGGLEGFYYFLSIGNAGREEGRRIAEDLAPHAREEFLEDFLQGEGYVKSPALVEGFVKELPIFEVPTRYVVFSPLSSVDPEVVKPEVVVFLVNPHQLCALVIMANYGRKGVNNVVVPYAAACQTIGIFAYKECRSEYPRAVLGLTDISARLHMKNLLEPDVFTMAVPWQLFLEMENEVAGSFLEKRTWRTLIQADC